MSTTGNAGEQYFENLFNPNTGEDALAQIEDFTDFLDSFDTVTTGQVLLKQSSDPRELAGIAKATASTASTLVERGSDGSVSADKIIIDDTSHAVTIDTATLSAARTLTIPDETGTVVTTVNTDFVANNTQRTNINDLTNDQFIQKTGTNTFSSKAATSTYSASDSNLVERSSGKIKSATLNLGADGGSSELNIKTNGASASLIGSDNLTVNLVRNGGGSDNFGGDGSSDWRLRNSGGNLQIDRGNSGLTNSFVSPLRLAFTNAIEINRNLGGAVVDNCPLRHYRQVSGNLNNYYVDVFPDSSVTSNYQQKLPAASGTYALQSDGIWTVDGNDIINTNSGRVEVGNPTANTDNTIGSDSKLVVTNNGESGVEIELRSDDTNASNRDFLIGSIKGGFLSTSYADGFIEFLTHHTNSTALSSTLTARGPRVGILDSSPSFTLDVNGTLRSTGNAQFDGNAAVTGSVSGASVAATGAITGASAAVTGALSGASVAATGAITGASAAVTGALTGASVAVTGAVTGASSGISGNATVGGTLDVTGVTTIGGETQINANTFLYDHFGHAHSHLIEGRLDIHNVDEAIAIHTDSSQTSGRISFTSDADGGAKSCFTMESQFSDNLFAFSFDQNAVPSYPTDAVLTIGASTATGGGHLKLKYDGGQISVTKGSNTASIGSNALTADRTALLPDADGTIALTSDIPAASQWTTTGSDIYYNSGNVGIGSTSPGNILEIQPVNSNDAIKILGHFQNNTTFLGAGGNVPQSGPVFRDSILACGNASSNGTPGNTYGIVNGFRQSYIQSLGTYSFQAHNGSTTPTTLLKLDKATSEVEVTTGDLTVAAGDLDVTAGDVSIGGTSLTVSDGVTTSGIRANIGVTSIGNGITNYAMFSHRNTHTTGGYALLQQSDGETFVNCAAGKRLVFRTNNGDRMGVDDRVDNKRIFINTPSQSIPIYNTLGKIQENYVSWDNPVYRQFTTGGTQNERTHMYSQVVVQSSFTGFTQAAMPLQDYGTQPGFVSGQPGFAFRVADPNRHAQVTCNFSGFTTVGNANQTVQLQFYAKQANGTNAYVTIAEETFGVSDAAQHTFRSFSKLCQFTHSYYSHARLILISGTFTGNSSDIFSVVVDQLPRLTR